MTGGRQMGLMLVFVPVSCISFECDMCTRALSSLSSRSDPVNFSVQFGSTAAMSPALTEGLAAPSVPAWPTSLSPPLHTPFFTLL